MQRFVPDSIRRRWTDRKIARKKFSCSTFMLYLGLEGAQKMLPHHTIYLSQNYEQNLSEVGVKRCLPTDPSFYVQNACVTDPTLAPAGRSTLSALVPVPHQTEGIDWARERATFRQLVFRQLEKIGLADVERRCRIEHAFTPADWQQQGIYRGATFNLAHSLRQMLHLRPRNRFEERRRSG